MEGFIYIQPFQNVIFYLFEPPKSAFWTVLSLKENPDNYTSALLTNAH